jgi:hypothetical protein
MLGPGKQLFHELWQSWLADVCEDSVKTLCSTMLYCDGSKSRNVSGMINVQKKMSDQSFPGYLERFRNAMVKIRMKYKNYKLPLYQDNWVDTM